MTRTSALFCLSGCLLLAGLPATQATLLAIDLDPSTPGIIDSTATIGVGGFVVADVYAIVDPGSFHDGYAINIEFNDMPGILGLAGPTTIEPGLPAPIGLFSYAVAAGGLIDGLAAPIPPGAMLTSAGIPPILPGPGGPFTAADGGSLVLTGAPAPGTFFGSPIPPPGVPVFLQSTTFIGLAPGVSDIAASGIWTGGLGLVGPGGAEFFDASSGLPIAATGIMPGTVTVIPEPASLTLIGLGLIGWLGRRRRDGRVSNEPR